MLLDRGISLHDLAEAADRARQIEEDGFDGAFSFDGPHDPFLPLAAAAQTTSRILLYPAVAVAFARNPMTVAQSAADLQRMTGGRSALGLGTQIRAHVEGRYGMPWGKPATRMQDFLAAIRAIWHSTETGEPLHHEGPYYRHTYLPPFFNPGPMPGGPPPILLAAVGPRMLQMAGEFGDGLLVHPFHSAQHLQEFVLPTFHEGRERAGKETADVTVIAQTMIALGHDAASTAAARQAAKAQLGFYGSTPAYRGVLDRHGFGELQPQLRTLTKEGRWSELVALVPDELVDLLVVSGTPDEVADALLVRNAGVDRTALVLYDESGPDGTGALVAAIRQR